METETIETETKGRKRGPVAGPPRLRTTLYLDAELVEWGKMQPGGLSELIRGLLIETRDKKSKRGA